MFCEKYLIVKGAGWLSDEEYCPNTESIVFSSYKHNTRATFRIIYYTK